MPREEARHEGQTANVDCVFTKSYLDRLKLFPSAWNGKRVSTCWKFPREKFPSCVGLLEISQRRCFEAFSRRSRDGWCARVVRRALYASHEHQFMFISTADSRSWRPRWDALFNFDSASGRRRRPRVKRAPGTYWEMCLYEGAIKKILGFINRARETLILQSVSRFLSPPLFYGQIYWTRNWGASASRTAVRVCTFT